MLFRFEFIDIKWYNSSKKKKKKQKKKNKNSRSRECVFASVCAYEHAHGNRFDVGLQ